MPDQTATWTLRPCRSDDYGWIVLRHGELYRREHGWDERFESRVAGIVSGFARDFDSAREHLIVTFVGRDLRDNEARPPSVVIDELLDHVGRAFVPAADDFAGRERHEKDPSDWARDRLVVAHPLKPWSREYFLPAPPDTQCFSYSEAWARAARRIAEPGTPPRPFVAAPVVWDRQGADVIRLEDLQQYFAHPARYFLRDLCAVRLATAEEQGPDREPLDLDGLEAFGVGDELLALAVAGGDPAGTLGRIAGSGILPLGESGRSVQP